MNFERILYVSVVNFIWTVTLRYKVLQDLCLLTIRLWASVKMKFLCGVWVV